MRGFQALHWQIVSKKISFVRPSFSWSYNHTIELPSFLTGRCKNRGVKHSKKDVRDFFYFLFFSFFFFSFFLLIYLFFVLFTYFYYYFHKVYVIFLVLYPSIYALTNLMILFFKLVLTSIVKSCKTVIILISSKALYEKQKWWWCFYFWASGFFPDTL